NRRVQLQHQGLQFVRLQRPDARTHVAGHERSARAALRLPLYRTGPLPHERSGPAQSASLKFARECISDIERKGGFIRIFREGGPDKARVEKKSRGQALLRAERDFVYRATECATPPKAVGRLREGALRKSEVAPARRRHSPWHRSGSTARGRVGIRGRVVRDEGLQNERR